MFIYVIYLSVKNWLLTINTRYVIIYLAARSAGHKRIIIMENYKLTTEERDQLMALLQAELLRDKKAYKSALWGEAYYMAEGNNCDQTRYWQLLEMFS